MTNQTALKQPVAKFSPPVGGFKSGAFTDWLDKEGGREYLQVDPYTLDGLKEVLKFSDIDESNIDWGK